MAARITVSIFHRRQMEALFEGDGEIPCVLKPDHLRNVGNTIANVAQVGAGFVQPQLQQILREAHAGRLAEKLGKVVG